MSDPAGRREDRIAALVEDWRSLAARGLTGATRGLVNRCETLQACADELESALHTAAADTSEQQEHAAEVKLCQICGVVQPCRVHGRTPVTDEDYQELHEEVSATLAEIDAADTASQIADLQEKLKKATNMARHNYQSAVHEQFNAEAHGHKPSPDYPPLVDDEFAAVLTRAEQAEQQIATLTRKNETLRNAWETSEADRQNAIIAITALQRENADLKARLAALAS